MINKRVTLAAATGLTAALVLTACGGGNSETALNTSAGQQAGPDLSQANPNAAEGGGGNAAAAGGGYGAADGAQGGGAADDGYGSAGGAAKGAAGVEVDGLSAKKTKMVGTIVVDSEQMTMYIFDKDKPGKSNCAGDCAAKWPPVLAKDKPELQGIEESAVGTVKRADGSEQLALNGKPLYRYALDRKAGDWKGIGVGGVWWAVQPNGKRAQKCLPGMTQEQSNAQLNGGGGAAPKAGSSGGSSGGYSY